MKKISVIFLVLGVCLLTACGTDDNEKKANQKETEVAKKETNDKSNKKAADQTTEKEPDQIDKTKEKEQTQTDKSTEKKSEEDNNETDAAKESEAVKPTAATSTISLNEFNESATLPITGGVVTTVFTGTNPKIAVFGPLNITISKYKVESVVGSDKEIDAYSPESYLGRRDGYVITLDVIVENTTNSTIVYKTDHTLLNGTGISKGASKENFIPNDKILNNSSDEFLGKSKKEGYITYMLNQEDFDKLKQSTTLTANNPNDFNSPAISGTIKGNITLEFPISK